MIISGPRDSDGKVIQRTNKMYKVTWDKETGGVQLTLKVVPDALSISPRPVFHEELDLLKLNKLGWEYPHCDEPLMWAQNKQYFYRGELCFEVKGANIYDPATVVFKTDKESMKLEPVNMELMLERNREIMTIIESEAIEFINGIYKDYAKSHQDENKPAMDIDYEALAAKIEKKSKTKMAIVKEECDSFDIMPMEKARSEGKRIFLTTRVDKLIASFSGGKDSQVVLDLCTRAIPPSEFEVLYSDTGYELPTSLELYAQTEEYYKRRFPELKFSLTRNHESVLNYWDKIGIPSDKQRWCCSIMKTAPLYRSLKIEGTNKQARVLTFDGVRAEESTRRSGYERIGKGLKHSTVVNARPILYWNSVEIFLYLFKHNMLINPSYRQGMTRVGCILCPFASDWNEMVANCIYHKSVESFELKLRNFAEQAGVKDIDNYIKEGGWKRRAGGNFLNNKSSISFINSSPNLLAIIVNPSIDILSYLWTVGEYHTSSNKNNVRGELKVKDEIYEFSMTINKKSQNIYRFELKNIKDAILIGHIKRVLFKSTYCINCEACEVECPTGALSVFPNVTIDRSLCIHCKKCLDFHDRGCIVANSLAITINLNMNNKLANLDRYKNFGLKEEWLDMYLADLDDYWTGNHGLHERYQIPALKCWLKDAGIINDKCLVTELGRFLSQIRLEKPNLVWEIVWINLTYGSFIVKWFINNIDPNSQYNNKMMEELIKNQFPTYKEKTIHNAVYQLMRTLRESPFGVRFSQYKEKDKVSATRASHTELSKEALAYSLYKYKEEKNINYLRVSDFYNSNTSNGPYKEFGIQRNTFEFLLRSLNSAASQVLTAELNMGLDNITLREDLDSLSAIKSLIGKK